MFLKLLNVCSKNVCSKHITGYTLYELAGDQKMYVLKILVKKVLMDLKKILTWS
jgi:hypothetical protein